MIHPSLLRWSSAMALVGVLALTGCSDDKKSGTDGSTAEEGPLSKILSAVWGNQDQEYYDKQQVEVENLVAECMADEGFEYIPQDNSGMVTTVTEEDWAARNTEEWVTENGYGMSMDMEATAEPVDPEAEEPQDWVDPNADYVNSLSEGEQTAYNEALWGAPNMGMTDEEMDEYVYNWEDGGCQGAAQHEVSGGLEDLYTDPRFEDLNEAMDEFYTSAQADPRLAELSADWASCMADAGYTFNAPDDAMMSVSDAQNELYSWEGGVDEEYTGPTSEAIAEFRKLEIATAVADFGCKQKVDWDETSQTVQFEREEVFVKDNKAALDEFVAAVQELQK